jgi:hypothetical protein
MEIDLLAEINEAAKEFEFQPEPPAEEPATETVEATSEEAEQPVVETKTEEKAPDVEALVASRVKEIEDRYKAELGKRVDLSQLDPDAYFEKTGADKELFFKKELFARAKEGTPLKEQLRKDLEGHEQKSEIQKLRNEMRAKEEAEANRQYVEAYTKSARDYIGKLDEKVTPTMAKLAKAGESDWVLQELLSEVRKDAQERFAKGDSGEPLTAEEALKRAESRYAKIAKVFATKEPDKKVVKPKNDVVVKPPAPPAQEYGQEWLDKMLKEAEREWFLEQKKSN